MKNAFQKCSSMTSITLPDTLTTIGKNTFYDTVKLINAGIVYKKVPYGKGYVNGFWGIKNKCTNSSTCDNDCNKISNGTNTNQPIQSDIANAG